MVQSKNRDEPKEVRNLTAVKRPVSTDANRTPKNAPMHMMKSTLSTLQILRTSEISINPGRAARIIDARMATGVKYNSLVSSSNEIVTVMAMMMLETAVWQPALKFTAVRENEPATFSSSRTYGFNSWYVG